MTGEGARGGWKYKPKKYEKQMGFKEEMRTLLTDGPFPSLCPSHLSTSVLIVINEESPGEGWCVSVCVWGEGRWG